MLAEAATEKYMKAHPVSESEMKAEYDTQVANMPKEYKARHILVDSKEKAEAIIKELAAGGDFAKIAAKESKDAGSGKNGGDLGWFTAQTHGQAVRRRGRRHAEGPDHPAARAERVRLARDQSRGRPHPEPPRRMTR